MLFFQNALGQTIAAEITDLLKPPKCCEVVSESLKGSFLCATCAIYECVAQLTRALHSYLCDCLPNAERMHHQYVCLWCFIYTENFNYFPQGALKVCHYHSLPRVKREPKYTLIDFMEAAQTKENWVSIGPCPQLHKR